MNDKDKLDEESALMPKPQFKAGDRVRSVHFDNWTGTVVDRNLPVQSQKPIDYFTAVNYDVQWDGRSAPEHVREHWLKPALDLGTSTAAAPGGAS